MSQNNEPKNRYRAGNVTVTEWENEVEIKGEKRKMSSFQVQKSYKDKEDNWKTTDSFELTAVPKLIRCLTKAYDEALFNQKE